MGVMSTNDQHRTGKGILVGENWKETIETHFVNNPSELRQDTSDQLQVPIGSILYQPVTVNNHYLKLCVCTEDVIADLNAYLLQKINREDCKYCAIGTTPYNLQLVL
jgi:hypothetical protein